MALTRFRSIRLFLAALTMLLLLLLPAGPVMAGDTIEPGVLRIGADLTYPPYAGFNGPNPSGFDPDFTRALAKAARLRPEFVDTRFSSLIPGLAARRLDVVASALYITPERSKIIRFIPYLKTGGALIVKSTDEARVAALADLCGKRISSVQGASWVPKLVAFSETHCGKRGLRPLQVLEFPTSPEAAQALLAGAADVMFDDAAVAKLIVTTLDGRLRLSSTELFFPVVIGLGIEKSNDALHTILTTALAAMKRDGSYAGLLRQYGLQEPSPSDVREAMGGQETRVAGFDWRYAVGLLASRDFWNASLLTIAISLQAWFLSLVIGFGLALGKQSSVVPVRWAASSYVWFFRSLPLLVLIIFIYNLPQIAPMTGAVLSTPYLTVLFALTISEAAYMAEIHRSGLIGVSRGQAEAGRALALSYFAIQRFIIMPQAIRIALPALTNELITIVKLTSLASVVSLVEILLVGQRLYTQNFRVLETMLAVAFYYVSIVTVFSWLLGRLEARLDVTRRRLPAPGPIAPLGDQPPTSAAASGSAGSLTIRKVSKSFGANPVLKGINLDIRPREVVSIIGPSGSGKTTLIRTINGLEPLDGGTVDIDYAPFLGGGAEARGLADYRGAIAKVGMVFQSFNLFPHRTVLDNVTLAPQWHRRGRPAALRSQAMTLLAKVGLAQHAGKFPHQLSGGQQQRVAIARALAMAPSIMLFDEPTSALDPELVEDVLNVIRELAEEGMTMIIVTHEIKFAIEVSTRMVFMDEGQIIFDGKPDDFINLPKKSRISDFIMKR